MGELYRQPSKVWWSSFPGADESDSAGRPWTSALRSPSPRAAATAANAAAAASEPTHGPDEGPSARWDSPDLTRSRGDSSSPSEGSHGSQDSGFSDSELHNALSSPQDSPELSKRLGEAEPVAGSSTASPNQRSKTSPVKKFSYQIVEFKEDCCNSAKTFLETSFGNNSPNASPRRNQYATSDDTEKINKIQNQLELSFKLPKKINSPTKVNCVEKNDCGDVDEASTTDGNTSESVRSSCSEHTVIEQPMSQSSQSQKLKEVSTWVVESGKRPAAELDRDGFKIPKCVEFRGSCTSLNFSANPPLSCSTPKGPKSAQGATAPQSSPRLVRPARAEEKAKSFATVRKLKGLANIKPRRSSAVVKALSSGECTEAPGAPHSVAQWLEELETLYEAEVMTTLQSKSLASDLARQVTNMAVTTSDTVRKLHLRTKAISSELTKLCQHMKCKKYTQIGPLAQSLISHIKEFMTEYVLNETCQRKQAGYQSEDSSKEKTLTEMEEVDGSTGDGEKRVAAVLEACDRLDVLVSKRPMDHDGVDKERIALAKEFREVVDSILLTHVKALVSVLEEPRTELALRTALSALCSLGLEGGQLSELVARCEGVRALLAVILEARATAVRVAALRALATVCCVADTVAQFQQAGGVEIVADLLSDQRRPEQELREAAAVLAQVTAPWVEGNPPLPELADHLPSLVSSLTRLVETYKTSETLLLSTAALANLTFLEPRTVWCLLDYNSAAILLAAVRKQGPRASVFIQEQAATVLANMAAIPEARGHLAKHRAVVALLCFLQIRHSPLQRAPEIAAAERVQQKTAIALSRLCSDATVAKQVCELQGVNRLVRLCKDERERNHSDGVLVACLAALRKIVANCGAGVIQELDAMELIEPRLLDSFLIYSSRQESYV